MSQVIIAGDTSGTVTLQAPAVSGSTVIALPATTGTMMVNGPAFSAYQSSAQTVSGATNTKIQFQTKEFDTASCFDATTNYRFTPNVAGYYQINACVTGSSAFSQMVVSIYTNGGTWKTGGNVQNAFGINASALVYLNGSTDYVEIYAYIATGQALTANAGNTFFQAAMMRGA